MFCNQCEQTSKGTGCVISPGVCGKDQDVQAVQELILYGLKGMAAYASHARRLGKYVYLGDERCVPPDDPDSNHRMIATTLLDRVGPVRGDHPMYTGGPAEAAAGAYQSLVAPLPDLGLVHLGLGPDGHTASLFPGSPALDDTDPSHLVVADRDPNGRNPHDRLTLTYAGIARARHVVVTVAGESEREAFARIASGRTCRPGG